MSCGHIVAKIFDLRLKISRSWAVLIYRPVRQSVSHVAFISSTRTLVRSDGYSCLRRHCAEPRDDGLEDDGSLSCLRRIGS